MRILMLCKDRPLTDLLIQTVIREKDEFTTTIEMDTILRQIAKQPPDVLIVSDRMSAAETISSYAEAIRATGKNVQLVILLSNYHHAENNAVMLKERLAEGWQPVLPGLTTKQVAQRIGRLLYGSPAIDLQARSGIIQLLGTTPNIGSTVAAFGIAAHMARLTDRSIAYLCLNLKSSKVHRYLGEMDPSVSLDGLRAELRSGSLTGERLRRQCRPQSKHHNLSVLYGNMQREQADYYTVTDIDCLLKAAQSTFDYCLVDTSAYWDNAATIGTMLQADQRILITTPQLSHFQEDMNRWLRTLSPVFGLSSADFDLLITQQDQMAPYRAKEVAKEANVSRIGELRRSPELDHQLAAGRLWESLEEGTPLGSDCARVARAILTLHGEPYASSTRIAVKELSWLSALSPIGRRLGFARK